MLVYRFVTSQRKDFKMNTTRKQLLVSGVIQLIIGSFCLIFGIAERALNLGRYYGTLTSIPCLAIWMGLWIGITGVLGILTKVEKSFKPMTGTYLGFSITSVVFAGTMIICYSMSLALFYGGYTYYDNSYYSHRYRVGYVMSILVLILSILEFGIGIWACVCCCMAFSGRRSPQPGAVGQVVYMQTQVGGPPTAHVIIQGPDGNPIAVPAQTSGPMIEQSGIPPHYSNLTFQQPQQSEPKVPLS